MLLAAVRTAVFSSLLGWVVAFGPVHAQGLVLAVNEGVT